MPENRLMRFISETSLDGVTEQLFTLGEVPGVLWTPEDADGARPLRSEERRVGKECLE